MEMEQQQKFKKKIEKKVYKMFLFSPLPTVLSSHGSLSICRKLLSVCAEEALVSCQHLSIPLET